MPLPTAELVDLSRLRPALMKCIDFQTQTPGKSLSKFKGDGVTFESNGGDLQIIDLPAPEHSHAWVPKMVHYLAAPAGWLYCTFDDPVDWVEVSLAPEDTGAKAAQLTVGVSNEKGQWSGMEVHDQAGLVKSFEFSATEMIHPPKGEFGTQPPPFALGSIKRVEIFSMSRVLLWRVCSY